MTKFNLGDKVKVLDGSAIPDYAGGWRMEKYIGMTGTVEYLMKLGDRIAVGLDLSGHMYDARGLEPVTEQEETPETGCDFTAGDYVIGLPKASELYRWTGEDCILKVTAEPHICDEGSYWFSGELTYVTKSILKANGWIGTNPVGKHFSGLKASCFTKLPIDKGGATDDR